MQNKKHHPWITYGILKSIKHGDLLYKKYIKQKDKQLKIKMHSNFKSFRNVLTNVIRRSKQNYLQSFFITNMKNSKLVWSKINSLLARKSKKSSLPVEILHNGTTVSDQTLIANIFNSFFTSIAKNIRDKIPKSSKNCKYFLKDPVNETIFLTPTNEEEIIKLISQLSNNKASGPNSIPTCILMLLKFELANPLATLFNLSLSTGVFPDMLKIANVIPVYKKDSKLNCSNYRPISLL